MKRPTVALAMLMALASPAAFSQMTSITSAGVRGTTELDLSQSSVNDPAGVEMLFKEGSTLASILDGLKEKGFHIEYKKKQLPPTMTLLTLPKGTRIDDVLHEILAPWHLTVYHSPYGKWIVRTDKDKPSELVVDPG